MIYSEQCKLLSAKRLDSRHIRLTLASGRIAGTAKPGQFVNVVCGESDFGRRVFESVESYLAHKQRLLGEHRFGKRLLRRPLAIHRLHTETTPPEAFDVLFKIVGKGTAALAQVSVGSTVDVLGPLGSGFDLSRADEAHVGVLVAGGVGLAPLYLLTQYLRRQNKETYAFIGALDESQIPIETADSDVPLSFMESGDEVLLTSRDFEALGVKVGITTERGSRGYRGLPTDLLEKYLSSVRSSARRYVRVYACGPWGMMRESAEICRRQRVACEVLLEERMGCGVGACMACSIKVKRADGSVGRKRICIDGPVFDAREVCWDD